MTVAPERITDLMLPESFDATHIAAALEPEPKPQTDEPFSLVAQLLNTDVLRNLIGESELPESIKPDDPQLVYYDLPGAGRMYLNHQLCRSGAARIHPFVIWTNNLLEAAYRDILGNFPRDTQAGPLTADESELVREQIANWWLKPNAAIRLGTTTNPSHWYAVTPSQALTPFDCLAQLHICPPRLLPDSVEWTLRQATRHL